MESGAKAALSGFRLQALYTLALILQDASIKKEFQPEGKEDLAVYENGRLIRAIQVKAHSAPLTLSDLAPRKEGSLLRRLVNSEDRSSILELVSFGPLGPELEAIQRREKAALESLSSKLREYGYSEFEISEIVRRLEIVNVDEINLREQLYRFFTHAIMAGDPGRAFDLLVWWIFQAAEHRRRITFQDLRDHILSVGRYLAERTAHHNEWFTAIKPLEEQPSLTTPSIETLAAEYYRGTAARYAHIRAGLDVRRDEQLQSLENYFYGGKRVVIIHGASGQGKTSLALRYLYEYVPTDWRFMVSAIDDRRHAASIANALANHLRVVDAPAWLFIDVAPRDLQWAALVQELLDIENIRILVAIREEDLARTTASESEIGFPADIRLEFTERDAANVYTQLAERHEAINAFPTFGEAWERFGGDGPLLEFVYLITQTESLRSVLATQVQRLREEVRSGVLEPTALQFLQICAIATSFEARVNLAPLVSFLELKDPVGTVALFENEYLLRFSTDGTQVEALHPVRSGLLARELHDTAFAPTEEAAFQGLPFIPEADLEVFLLYLLSRMPSCWSRLQESLPKLEIKTWTGASGIGRVLLWWGVKCYLEENRGTIEEMEQFGGDAWATTLFTDAAGALDTDIVDEILALREQIHPGSTKELRQIRSNLTPTLNLFKPLSDWLVSIEKIAKAPSNLVDWQGVAELTFWAGRLGIAAPIRFDIADIHAASLPVMAFAQLSLALSGYYPEKQSELLQLHGETMKARFREEMDILILREDEQCVTAEFIVPFDLLSGMQGKELGDFEVRKSSHPPGIGEDNEAQRFGAKSERIGSILNSEAVRRVEFLRGLFSEKGQYCTQGHGHQISFCGIKLPRDSTTKQMLPKATPAPWPVRVNSTLHNLEAYRSRPETWRHFAELILSIRETVAQSLLQLLRALISYFEGNSARTLFGGTLSAQLWENAKNSAGAIPYLPKSTVDEWGLSSETKSQHSANTKTFSNHIASEFYLRQHKSFLSATQKYMSCMSLFFSQAEIICSVHGLIGRNSGSREKVLGFATSQLGYEEANIGLSTHNLFQGMLGLEAMQYAFDERLDSLVKADHLKRVRRRESELFPNLWALWYQFCHFPEKRMFSASVQSFSAMESSILPLRDALTSTLGIESWSTKIISEQFSWTGHPSLVLSLDLSTLEFLEIARVGIFSRLYDIFKSVDFDSLTDYAVKYHWHHILIVPTINGIALESGAWVIPTVLLSSNNEESPDRPLWRLLHPLSEEQAAELGIKTNPGSRISVLDDLLKVLAELQLLFSHLGLFGRLAPNLDELGILILKRYLEKLGEQQLNQRFDKLQELLPEVLRRVREVSTIQQEMLDILLHPIERLG